MGLIIKITLLMAGHIFLRKMPDQVRKDTATILRLDYIFSNVGYRRSGLSAVTPGLDPGSFPQMHLSILL